MKFRLAVVALCAMALAAQEYPAGELKRLSVPTLTSVRPVAVTAREIDRDLPYNGILHLKGSVEIKTAVCVATGPNNTQSCDGYVVLHADEAEFHEDSGQIEARGNVIVTREK